MTGRRGKSFQIFHLHPQHSKRTTPLLSDLAERIRDKIEHHHASNGPARTANLQGHGSAGWTGRDRVVHVVRGRYRPVLGEITCVYCAFSVDCRSLFTTASHSDYIGATPLIANQSKGPCSAHFSLLLHIHRNWPSVSFKPRAHHVSTKVV